MNRLTHILTLLIALLAGLSALAQSPYVIDVVCVGAERHYKVDGEPGSTYVWMLTDAAGVIDTLPETADTVTIRWNVPIGIYYLSTIQHDTATGCDGLLEIGYIEVIDGPVAYAGDSVKLCLPEPYRLENATASNYSTVLWTTAGDGFFDDPALLNPVYNFGANDILAGSVTLTLTAQGLGNAGSCPPAASPVIITLDNLQVNSIIVPASCPAVSDGAVTLIPSGGNEPYVFELNGITQDTGYYNHLAAGDYTYTVTDAGGCTATGTVSVGLLPAITATVETFDESYLGADDGRIIVHADGGSGSYEYSIDDNMLVWQADSVFTGLTPGTYNVFVRDSLAPACWWTTRVVIGTSPALIAQFEHTDITCFGAADGSITFLNPQNGSGHYEFSIDNAASWHGELVYTGLIPGTYTLWMRDSLNTANTQMLGEVIIQPAVALHVDIAVVPETAAGANDGRIILSNPTGGSGSYEYSIDGGTTWQSGLGFSPLAPGDYTVIMRDSLYTYCEITLPVVHVPAADALYAVVTVYNISCYGAGDGRITLRQLWGGSGSYEFSIDGGTTWVSDSTFSGLTPGDYTIIMRDALQTTNTATFGPYTITEPGELSADVTFTASTCAGNDATITVSNATGGSGFYEYSYTGFTWQSDTIFTGLAGGFPYMIFIRDSLQSALMDPDCIVNLGTFFVPADCPLTANVDTTAITCWGASDGSITITNPQGGSGFYEYTIDGTNWSSQAAYTNLDAGTYTVMVRDLNNPALFALLRTVILTNPQPLTAIVSVTHETIPGANDGTLTITAPQGGSGQYEYSLDNTNWQTGTTFGPLAPGDYIVYIRDLNNPGCVNPLGPYTILPADVLYAVGEPGGTTCFGGNDGTITVTGATGGSGQFEYSLDSTNWQQSDKFSGLAAGFYTVYLRDLNNPRNVTIIPNVEVIDPAQLNALAVPAPINCNGSTTGSIIFNTVTGGSGTYEYSIDEGLTWHADSVFTGLGVGEYIVMLRDSSASWCYRAIDTLTIMEGVAINIAVRTREATCGQPNGEIYVMADGGAQPFEYMLEGVTGWQTGDTFTGLAPGPYTVRVRDAAACESVYPQQVIILPAPSPVITDVEVWNAVNGSNDGHIIIHTTGGTPPLTYSIDGLNYFDNPRFDNLGPGMNLAAYVLDANGCADTMYFNMGNVILGDIEIRPGRVAECQGTEQILPITVINFDSVASFRIRLSYDPNIITYTGLGDIHNNLLASNVNVVELTPGVLEVQYHHPTGVTSVPDGQTMIELKFMGAHAGLTGLNWQFLECVVFTSIGFAEPHTIGVDSFAEVLPLPHFTAFQDGIFCSGDSTVLRTESANLAELAFEWTHPRGIKHYGPTWNLGTLTTLDSGYYRVQGFNPEQCSADTTIHVTVYPEPDLHIAYADTICFGNPVVLDPGNTFTQYEWSDGSMMPSIIAYEAGIYWVKVVDFNGCRAIDSVELVPCILEVLIPNAFSPNGDGLNDDFEPIFRGFEPAQYRMDIYSKWGQLIYSTTALGHGWDGRVNGQLVYPDVFTYVVSYEVPSYVLRRGLTSPITGKVTVVR